MLMEPAAPERSDLPADWDRKRIRELATVVRGASPRPAGDQRYFNGSFIPWLTVASLTSLSPSQLIVNETASRLTAEGASFSRKLRKNTVIIANSGATLGVAKLLGIDCCANDGIAALLNLSPFVSRSYIIQYINSQTQYLRDVVAPGNGQPNLNTDLIGNISIPLPKALAEQEAIAQALNAADTYIESLAQLLAKKRAVTQGAIQDLLTGKRRMPPFKNAWRRKQLADIVEVLPSGVYGSERYSYGTVAAHVATTAHISDDDQWNGKPMPVRFFPTELVPRYVVREKDLVVVKSSGSAASIKSGKIGFVTAEEAGKFLFSNFLMVLRATAVNPSFLYFYLTSPMVKSLLPSLVEASTYPNIRLHEYLALEIPIPSEDEQHAIASSLSDMRSEMDVLYREIDKAWSVKKGMMQELFTGRVRLA